MIKVGNFKFKYLVNIMKNIKKSLVTGSIILASMTISKASMAITLEKSANFAGAGPDIPSLFVDLGDSLELTVTAGVHSGGARANAPLNITGSAKITQTGGRAPGIGVRSGQKNDSSELDASGPNEFLRFTFNQEVTLLSVIFEAASNSGPGTDEFDSGIDGIDLQINSTFGNDRLRSFPDGGFSGGTDRLVDFSGGVDFAGDGTNALFPATGLIFDFYTDDKNDSFRIAEITVSHHVVPEPLTILGAGTAVAFATSFKRKLATALKK